MKIILAVDGSAHSRLAAQYVASHLGTFGNAPRVTAIHVDPPLMSRVASALGRDDVERYHAENAQAAFRDVHATFEPVSLAFDEVAIVGDPGEAIAKQARDGGYELVVMGSHGHGAFRNLLLGSVVTKVLGGCAVPVLVVR